MDALMYLTKRTFSNRLRKAMKKPLTYIYIVLIGAYIVMILVGWGILARSGGVDSVNSLVYILTVWLYIAVCSNFISYAKLKGVIFKPSHSHYIFPAPVSPKKILLYGAAKNFIINLVIDVAIALAGVTIFHLSVWRAFLLYFVMFVCETVFEASLIIFLYAKEKRFEPLVKIICKSIYVLIGVIAVIVLLFIKKNGFSASAAEDIFNLPALQLVPVAGWCVASVRLVILGPETVNVIGSVLFFLSCAGMFFAAFRMKCSGAYYEDAAKFADDYAEMKSRSKKGEVVLSVGRKKKFKKAGMHYQGSGAKAIFYRQLLEYKKEKFFIFGAMTLYSIIGAAICVFVIDKPEKIPPGLSLLGVMAYLIFLTTGYLGKWNKELANPYIYLIPDKPMKKLWYATAMEHVKSLADGIVLAVPVGIAWHIPVYQIIMCILIYCVLQANRLYIKILGESILGSTLGSTGKNLFAMAVQGGILGAGIGLAALMGFRINYNFVFPIMLIYSMMITVLIALLTVGRFETMEQWD